MPKLYTKTGDKGETGLLTGERVSKDHPRVCACGSVDELNAVLGLAKAFVPRGKGGRRFVSLKNLLTRIQEELFVLGSDLSALSPPSAGGAPRISAGHVLSLEREIDRYWRAIPPLKNFVLPGGSPLCSCLDLARTVCRRVERDVVAALHGPRHQAGGLARLKRQGREASTAQGANPEIIRYLNRLSDLFFALARWVSIKKPLHKR